MAAFPRTVLPRSATWPTMPAPLISVGLTGKVQTRTTLENGRTWTETYGPFLATNATWRGWLAEVLKYWRTGTVLSIDHRSQRGLLGAGGGTPLVQGASQTGATLITDGWTGSTTVLKAGDVLTIAGLNPVYEVTANVTSTASGTATLSLSPAILTGNAPADNAALTINSTPGSVLYRAYLVGVETWPAAGPEELYSGLVLTFKESP